MFKYFPSSACLVLFSATYLKSKLCQRPLLAFAFLDFERTAMTSQSSPLLSTSGGSTSPGRSSNATSNYPSTDSSGLSSRHAFRAITRDILASSSPTLPPPSVMSHGSLEPAKYNPQADDSSQPSDAYVLGLSFLILLPLWWCFSVG